jgi:hypothetical protein
MYVTKRAVAVNFVENDSVSRKKLMVTGKETESLEPLITSGFSKRI